MTPQAAGTAPREGQPEPWGGWHSPPGRPALPPSCAALPGLSSRQRALAGAAPQPHFLGSPTQDKGGCRVDSWLGVSVQAAGSLPLLSASSQGSGPCGLWMPCFGDLHCGATHGARGWASVGTAQLGSAPFWLEQAPQSLQRV